MYVKITRRAELSTPELPATNTPPIHPRNLATSRSVCIFLHQIARSSMWVIFSFAGRCIVPNFAFYILPGWRLWSDFDLVWNFSIERNFLFNFLFNCEDSTVAGSLDRSQLKRKSGGRKIGLDRMIPPCRKFPSLSIRDFEFRTFDNWSHSIHPTDIFLRKTIPNIAFLLSIIITQSQTHNAIFGNWTKIVEFETYWQKCDFLEA